MNRPIQKSSKGRKCKYPNCNRALSIYNHETQCHVHRHLGAMPPARDGIDPSAESGKEV